MAEEITKTYLNEAGLAEYDAEIKKHISDEIKDAKIAGLKNGEDGENSVAMQQSSATGDNSLAGGVDSEARNANSFVFGKGLKSVFDNSTVVGQYNRVPKTSALPTSGEAIFAVGNGKSDTNRSNAFEVWPNGRAWLAEGPINNNDVVIKSYVDDKLYNLQQDVEQTITNLSKDNSTSLSGCADIIAQHGKDISRIKSDISQLEVKLEGAQLDPSLYITESAANTLVEDYVVKYDQELRKSCEYVSYKNLAQTTYAKRECARFNMGIMPQVVTVELDLPDQLQGIVYPKKDAGFVLLHGSALIPIVSDSEPYCFCQVINYTAKNRSGFTVDSINKNIPISTRIEQFNTETIKGITTYNMMLYATAYVPWAEYDRLSIWKLVCNVNLLSIE